MSDIAIDKPFDDTEYFEPKLCAICKTRNADEGEVDCKFCWRRGRKAGFANLSKPMICM